MEENKTIKKNYFAAANGYDGFVSYFDKIFDTRTLERLFILKGGPGTGKNSFMRRVSDYFSSSEYETERFYCSSDPSSLDGKIIKKGGIAIAIIDGTAPHEMLPRIPGVQEQLIDLGAFWSCRQLRAQRESIRELVAEKAAHYAAAYRDLAAAGLCEQTASELMEQALDHRALTRLCERLVSGAVGVSGRGLRKGVRAAVRTVCTRAISMRGRTQLDTLVQQAARVCYVGSYYGVEYRLMNALLHALIARGEQITVSRHPVFPAYADGIWLPQHGVAFVTDMAAPAMADDEAMPATGEHACYTRSISPRRTVERARLQTCRPQLRHVVRQRDALIADAERELMAAASPHFALEAIYGAAMDFDAKEAYCHAQCEDIFRE
jgi:hypothetical protein